MGCRSVTPIVHDDGGERCVWRHAHREPRIGVRGGCDEGIDATIDGVTCRVYLRIEWGADGGVRERNLTQRGERRRRGRQWHR